MSEITLSEENTNRVFTFLPGIYTIGKSSTSDFQLTKNYISRQHARIYYENGSWFLFDLNSTNGTYLNGIRINPKAPYRLKEKDRIIFANMDKYTVTRIEEKDEVNSHGLEYDINVFVQSDYKNTEAFANIQNELKIKALYFPVRDSTIITPDNSQIISDDFLTIRLEDGIEYLPMFTSRNELEKGPAAKFVCLSPKIYAPLVVNACNDIVVNPFSTAYKISSMWLKQLILSEN